MMKTFFQSGRQRLSYATLSLLACLLVVWPVGAQSSSPELARKIEAALEKLGRHSIASVRVISLPERALLYERHPDFSMNPASNMKLFTSAVALDVLGVDYRYQTDVLQDGELRGGMLRGNLILRGGGDPVLETPHLEKLADVVQAAGVKEVAGDLVADDYRYDERRLGRGWSHDYETYYYAAQISALSLNRNVAVVSVYPGSAAGEEPVVTVRPAPGYLTVTNRAKTTASGSSAITAIRARARNEVIVTGSIPVTTSQAVIREVTVEEPALFTAACFRQLLAERGIRVSGVVRRQRAPDRARVIATHQSAPMSEIASLLNKPSDNLVAEMMLKELGFVRKESGDAVSGSEVVEGWLKERGIDAGGVRVNDGSGLSRGDLVTARAVSELLAYADTQPWKEVFQQSLPVAGVDGTLRSRMKGTRAEGQVRAKTGTLLHVTALGGYATTRDGRRVAFSILINGHPGPSSGPNGSKRVEDEIVLALVE